MERKYVISIFILLVLIIGAGAYVYAQSNSHCPATLSVDVVENESAAAEDVVEFEDLAPHQQREFERSLEDGPTKIGSQSDWAYDWVVHYHETNYSVSIGIC